MSFFRTYFASLLALRTLTRLLGITLVLTLAAAGLATAQAFYYVPTPAATATFAPSASYVARVVDARPQRASLGLVLRGGSERAATFREGVANTLQTFFQLHAPGQPGAVPLVMRLSGLEIAEMPGNFVEGRLAETATAGLVADFYAPQPDSSYQLVLRFTKLRQETAFDATGQHATNLGGLLIEAAEQVRRPALWLTNGPHYSKKLVLETQPLPSESLPVLAPQVQPLPGFYHTLTEFWFNQPSEPGQPVVERHPYTNLEWAGDMEVKAYHQAGSQHALATDVWGFCDGQDFYIRRGRSFYKLTRHGTDFVFFGSASEDPVFRKASSSRATNSAYLVGGALGGALAGVADAAIDSSPRCSLKLSLLTGEVRLVQSNSGAATAIANRPTHLFIYRPRAAKGSAVRIRLADDQPAQELAAGDYLTFEPASDQPLRVCLLPTTGPEAYLAITPTSEAPTYLECRPGTPEPLHKVKDAAGAAALSKLVK